MFVKIIVAGIIVCLISIFLKKYFNEFVLPVELIFLSFAVAVLTEAAGEILSEITQLVELPDYTEDIFGTMIKGTGISLLTKFSADISQENGNSLVASVIEFSGRIMITLIAFPYIKAVIGIAEGFLE